jgi:cobalt/nickel transport system permease protein
MRIGIVYPPLRIFVYIFMLSIGVTLERMEAILCLIMGIALWMVFDRISIYTVGRRMGYLIPIILFLFAYFFITDPHTGLYKAAMYAGRMIFAVQLVTMLLDRMSYPVFFQSLLILRIPSVFVEMLLFTMRFLEVSRTEALSMLYGIRSRGFKVKRWFSLSAYMMLSKIVGALMQRVLRRSERVYFGMLSRGYRGIVPTRPIPHFHSNDVWKAAGFLSVTVGLFLWNQLGGVE